MNPSIIGIDYGSKLAGTTVIAYQNKKNIVQFLISEKKKDADIFLINAVTKLQPKYIFFDAPLSLPGVYTMPNEYDDYFYRAGDRLLKAMSPMFLGGLTARAMRLKRTFIQQNIEVFETYPAIHAQRFQLKNLNYKKKLQYLPDVIQALQKLLPFPFNNQQITSWHHVDALLAFYSAYRFLNGEIEQFGAEKEGSIWV
jgi:predicted nuclease with RNAse H fold